MESINEYGKAGGNRADHIRLVRDDYKNLTISLPSDTDIVSLLFHKNSSKDTFLQTLISDGEIDNLIKETAIIKGQTVDDVKKIIQDNWNFGVGKSRVEFGAKDEQKLHAFAQAELVSRDGLADANISIKTFDGTRPLKFAKEAVQKEKNIIKNY